VVLGGDPGGRLEGAPDPEEESPARPAGKLSKRELDRDFAEWWDQCPKQEAIDDARRAYERARKGSADRPPATADELLTGMMRYAVRVIGKDPQYIAAPANWLKGGRWKDAPPPTVNGFGHGRPDGSAGAAVALAVLEMVGGDQ